MASSALVDVQGRGHWLKADRTLWSTGFMIFSCFHLSRLLLREFLLNGGATGQLPRAVLLVGDVLGDVDSFTLQ